MEIDLRALARQAAATEAAVMELIRAAVEAGEDLMEATYRAADRLEIMAERGDKAASDALAMYREAGVPEPRR